MFTPKEDERPLRREHKAAAKALTCRLPSPTGEGGGGWALFTLLDLKVLYEVDMCACERVSGLGKGRAMRGFEVPTLRVAPGDVTVCVLVGAVMPANRCQAFEH